MFWTILAVIVSIGMTIWAFVYTRRYREIIVWILVPLVAAGAALLAIIGLGISNLMAYDVADTELQLDNTYGLYALNDNTEASGSFFLGNGYVDSKPVYYVMLKTERGYEMRTYNIAETILIYTENEPRVEHYNEYFTNPMVRFFCGDNSMYVMYKIYVPEGSIIQNYMVDLE